MPATFWRSGMSPPQIPYSIPMHELLRLVPSFMRKRSLQPRRDASFAQSMPPNRSTAPGPTRARSHRSGRPDFAICELRNGLRVGLRRRLLVGFVLAWMGIIAFLDYLTMMPGSKAEERVEAVTRIPFAAARSWLRGLMS